MATPEQSGTEKAGPERSGTERSGTERSGTDKSETTTTTASKGPSARARAGAGIARGRTQLARIVRIVFTLAALLLAVGALLVALRSNINETNAIVKLVIDVDDVLDGPFSRTNGIFTFSGKNAETKDALVNWGIAALAYLLVGRVLDKVIRP